MSSNKIYDVVFAGGGTTACVIAGRLAAADPSLKILVLEAGPHTNGLPEHYQPARFLSHLGPDSKVKTFHVAKPSDHLAGRSVVVSCGHCVGGGSSINLMMYTRASASDYDDWATVHKNPGWSSADLLPLLKKTETYQVKDNEPTHGYTGPLKVSYGGIFTNIGKQFLEVATQYDKKREIINDSNNLYSCNAYARWQKWINGETGRRSDVPHHFIYNQGGNKNLEVRSGCKVIRVIFENHRAVGVEYTNDPVTNPDGGSEVHITLASKLVVVSAGAFGSPAILERSGIGAKAVLERCGVEQTVDLPGVGENYQDHNSVLIPYLASSDAETIDAIARNDQVEIDKYIKQWTQNGQGFWANNFIDSGIKYRPFPEELKALGPEFQEPWSNYFVNAPDKPIVWLGTLSGYPRAPSTLVARKYFGITYFTMYPFSRGFVHISSGTDLNAGLDFDPRFLTGAGDVAVLRYAYKRARELARRMPFFEGELSDTHPTFAEGSPAAFKDSSPVDIAAPDIVYSEEDDKAIDEFHRQTCQTSWHSLGTCAMKPRENDGVVDAQLNVYGVQGLKVADMSIAPSNVGSNTYSTALVIGEKAAAIIAKELGVELA